MSGKEKFINMLSNPICFGDLLGNGATLHMNANFDNGITDEIYDELYGSDDDDYADNTKKVSPWLGSFEELKSKMIKIDDTMYKRIIEPGNMTKGPVPKKSRASINYSSYWQGENKPFDSSSFSFNTGECNVLEGLEKAVCTMYEGEKAQFVISHKLLFGEIGCPPRIKRRADGLYEIELISYCPFEDKNDTDYEIHPENRKKFVIAYKKSKELHLKGLNFYKQGMYKYAANVFEKAGTVLDCCQLANEVEEKVQVNFLIRIYTNLVVTYNKLNKPSKTCIICRKIWQLSDNKPSCKVLFHKGRALVMLGDYINAKKFLKRAQSLEPNNIEVKKELEDLEKRSKHLHETNESIRKNALGIDDVNDLSSNEKNHLHSFQDNMLKALNEFKNNSEKKVYLPTSLTEKEINLVEDLAKHIDINLTFSETEKQYSLNK